MTDAAVIADLHDKVDRIVAYLAAAQDVDGEFPSVRCFYKQADGGTRPSEFPGWYYFYKCPFFTATILYHLNEFTSPQVESIRRRGCEFLAGCFEGPLVRYVPARYLDVWFPADVDDTCLVRKVLRDNGVALPSDDGMLLRSRDRRGRFYTWFMPRPRYVTAPRELQWLLADLRAWTVKLYGHSPKEAVRLLKEYWVTQEPAVDANVLLYFGDDPRVRGLDREIVDSLRRKTVRLEYYDSMIGAYFHTARVYAAGASALGVLRDEIVRYVIARQDAVTGCVHNGLDTAMAALTLLYLDYWEEPLRRAIDYLQRDPMHERGWQPIAYVNPVNRVFSDGAAGLTAIFYADALRRYADGLGTGRHLRSPDNARG